MKHAYFKIDGVEYKDYTLYDIYTRHRRNQEDREASLVLDGHFSDSLKNLTRFVDSSIRPPKGTELYVAPNCPYSSNDLRNHYKIKRAVDTGKYNVLTTDDINNKYFDYFYACELAVFPSKKIALVTNESVDSDRMFYFASAFDSTLERDDMIHYHDISMCLQRYDIADIYKMFLDGTVKKPCIWYKQLDINNENELTEDVLKLVYKTGTKMRWETDAVKNYVIQLNVLNQHNWREYPGTISMLMRCMNEHSYTAHSEVHGHLSSQQKSVAEIVRTLDNRFASEKDFLMAQKFVDGLLGVGGNRFVAFSDVRLRLGKCKVPLVVFNALYSSIVRIQPRTFSNE